MCATPTGTNTEKGRSKGRTHQLTAACPHPIAPSGDQAKTEPPANGEPNQQNNGSTEKPAAPPAEQRVHGETGGPTKPQTHGEKGSPLPQAPHPHRSAQAPQLTTTIGQNRTQKPQNPQNTQRSTTDRSEPHPYPHTLRKPPGTVKRLRALRTPALWQRLHRTVQSGDAPREITVMDLRPAVAGDHRTQRALAGRAPWTWRG